MLLDYTHDGVDRRGLADGDLDLRRANPLLKPLVLAEDLHPEDCRFIEGSSGHFNGVLDPSGVAEGDEARARGALREGSRAFARSSLLWFGVLPYWGSQRGSIQATERAIARGCVTSPRLPSAHHFAMPVIPHQLADQLLRPHFKLGRLDHIPMPVATASLPKGRSGQLDGLPHSRPRTGTTRIEYP